MATARATKTAPARSAPARRTAPQKRSRSTASPAKRRRGSTPITGFVPVAVGRTAGAVGGIADSGLFVWLTRGRLWIGLLGGLLVGIVGLNVMALSFSASSSTAGQQADDLRQANSALRADLAKQLSSQSVQDAARQLGLVFAAPGSVRYLHAAPNDAEKAAQRLRDGELGGSAYVPPPVTETTDSATLAPTDTSTATAPTDPTTAPTADSATTVPTDTVPTDTAVPTDATTAPTDAATTEAPVETAPPATTDTPAAGGVGAP
jgi:hypothetical protein